jgi:hypothetical protein
MATVQLQQPQTSLVLDESVAVQPPFFQVSVTKLIVLTICTLGFYQLYWFYKNWQLIRDREDIAVLPAARALFAYFYCYQAFCRVRDFPTTNISNSRLPAGPLAAGWIVTTFLSNLPDPYWLISFSAVAFVVPVQAMATKVNAVVAPGSDPNRRFSAGNWATVGLGGALFALALIGTFMEQA